MNTFFYHSYDDMFKLSAKKYNREDNPSVYILYKKTDRYSVDEVVYVGRSSRCQKRIKAHFNDRNKDFDYAQVLFFNEVYDSVKMEEFLIRKWKPELNKNQPYECMDETFDFLTDENESLKTEIKKLKKALKALI